MGPILGQEDITVGATATKTATPKGCRSVLIKALKANTEDIFYGNDTVTTATGMPLSAGESVREDEIPTTECLYFISVSGGQHVRLLYR